jgi:DNA-binding IclR family transcriptional regulator
MDVLDYLGRFPGRSFTLTEIARATDINLASSHAVLSALVARGYLTYSSKGRVYTLGPALVALGETALKCQPLIARAKQAADQLVAEFGVPVLASTVIGEEIVGVVSIGDASGRSPGLRVGERLPLVPPIGAPFLAWAPEPAIEAWIARGAASQKPGAAEEWRHTLSLTRERGFQVTLGAKNAPNIANLMAQMATDRRAQDRLFNTLDLHMPQPETIEPEKLYDVVLIAAPLFDENGATVLNLCFGGFADKLTGAEVTRHAEQLVRTCLDLMRAEREKS